MPIGPIPGKTAWRTTGQMRLRPLWFSLVVIEVEETCQTGTHHYDGFRPTGEVSRWRIARPADFRRAFFGKSISGVVFAYGAPS
jgi:hypothetical protein